ncbi:MAG: HPF/RaiA family ribosome-associated protein [Gammaproteobacteria bacterium]|jgi:ribosomal subunit interface protein
MKLPLQVSFRNMDSSAAVEANIREKAMKLDQFCDHIMSCRVIVESLHKHHHQGNLFHVRIDITVPDEELVVSRDPAKHHAHEDVYVVIRDAFDAARRQLQDYNNKRQQHVKHHEPESHGHVIRLIPMEDYGVIATPDGREVYFHRNSVLNTEFDKLEEGAEVRFNEESGEQGPQASTVLVEGKHHVVG